MPKVKSFKHYLSRSGKEYHYRIKTVCELDDQKMDRIERLLVKYDVHEISRPQKTLMQRHPLDFPDLDHAEVWILDVITGLPVSSYILQQELRAILEITEKFIVVRNDNDPLELETERINAEADMDADAEKEGMSKEALLAFGGEYTKAEQGREKIIYGDEYNSKLMNYLAHVAANRKPSREDFPPLFQFIDPTKPDDFEPAEDFNKNIKGAPKSKPWWDADDEDEMDFETMDHLSPEGNFDDDKRTYSKLYNKDGNPKELSITTVSIRDRKKGK